MKDSNLKSFCVYVIISLVLPESCFRCYACNGGWEIETEIVTGWHHHAQHGYRTIYSLFPPTTNFAQKNTYSLSLKF